MIDQLLEKLIEQKLQEMLGISDKETSDKEKQLIGEPVIIRCRDAGVHFGELVDYNGREVVLKNARRMWYWYAAEGHTLSGCALHGIKDKSQIAGTVDKIVLPEACEIISCTEKAAKSIGGADEYQPS